MNIFYSPDFCLFYVRDERYRNIRTAPQILVLFAHIFPLVRFSFGFDFSFYLLHKRDGNKRMMMYCLRNLCVSCSIICLLLFQAKTPYVCVYVSECWFGFVYRYKCYFSTGTYVHSHSHRTKWFAWLQFSDGFSYSVFISALISAVNIIHIVRRREQLTFKELNSFLYLLFVCLHFHSVSFTFLHINFWYCSAHCGLANGIVGCVCWRFIVTFESVSFLLFVNIGEQWTGSFSMCVRLLLCNI